jgi:hypothetical protein
MRNIIKVSALVLALNVSCGAEESSEPSSEEQAKEQAELTTVEVGDFELTKTDLLFSWTEAENATSYKVTLTEGESTEELEHNDNQIDLSERTSGNYTLTVEAVGEDESKTESLEFEIELPSLADYDVEIENMSYTVARGDETTLASLGKLTKKEGCHAWVDIFELYEFKDGFFLVSDGRWATYTKAYLMEWGCIFS